MDKRANVLQMVRKGKAAYVPSGFWLHFPPEAATGEAAVQAHLAFFQETGVDVMKIMNEHVVPCDVPIGSAADWKRLKRFSPHSPFLVKELDLMKEVMDRTKDPGVFLLTVHGLVASMWHARGGTGGYEEGRALLARHLREDPHAFASALDVIAEALSMLVEKAVEAGIDGIYYAALGGERNLFTKEEFDRYLKPRELAILQAASGKKGFDVLHMCKDGLDLSRYLDYPCEVFNWGVYSDNISLEEGRKLFGDKTILGGFDDRSGVLVDGTMEEIRQYAQNLVARMGHKRFILGADCTLPTDIDRARIRIAAQALRDI